MSRNDIRLRRKRMTSRRIERHKNYEDLMKKHKKSSMLRTGFRWAVVGILVLLAIFLIIFFT